MQWAQVVAHDVTLLTEKSGKCTDEKRTRLAVYDARKRTDEAIRARQMPADRCPAMVREVTETRCVR